MNTPPYNTPAYWLTVRIIQCLTVGVGVMSMGLMIAIVFSRENTNIHK